MLGVAIGSLVAIWPTAILAAEPGADALDAYLPAEGTRAVVAVADAPRAWQALDAAGLGDAMLPAFRGVFSALEWALVATKPEADGTANKKGVAGGAGESAAAPLSPAAAESGAALLCLARVADPERLRGILPGFERAVAATLGTGNIPVGRTEEAIGDVTVVVLTNGEQAAGYLLSGRLGVWASCTEPALLRATARRIARDAPSAPSAKGSLAEARAAAARLRKEGNAVPIALVLLPAPGASRAAALGAVDWLRAILGGTSPQPVVAAVTLEKRAIRAEALAVGAARGSGEAAPQSVAAFPPLGDLCAAPSGALVQWGTTRLNAEDIRQALLGQVDRSISALPPPNRAGLTPASDLQRRRLAALRATLADTQRWPLELGPEAWVVLNRFEFGREGELPTVDLVAATRTRDEAAMRAHLAEWEARLLAAVSPQAPGGKSSPPAGTSAPRFSEREEKLASDGQTVRLRWLDAPALPAGLRPAWALRGDLLCVALSPDSLAEALRRAAAAAPQNAAEATPSPARTLVERLGLPRPGAALAAWPGRSAGLAAVLRVLAVRTSEPWMAGLLGGAADRWQRAESVAVAREDDPDGVRTVARVVLSAAPSSPAATPGPAAAKNAGETPTEKATPPGSVQP